MSDNSNSPIRNESWLFSAAAARSIHYLELDLAWRSAQALREDRDNVRRALEYPPEGNSELPEYVVREREFPFTSLDSSLFENATLQDREIRRTRPYISRTPSRVSSRGEFSLTSYDSDIFNPEEILERYAMSANDQAQPSGAEQTEAQQFMADAERELQEIHQTIRENPAARVAQPNVARERDDEVRDTLRAVIQEIRRLQTDIDAVRETQLHTQRIYDYRPSRPNRRDTTIIDHDDDVRHRRGRGTLPLKEARCMIPEFDGNASKLQEFLSAMTYAVENIDPADEVTLLGAILCTKLKGRAMLDFQTRKVRDFEQLKQELEACYASKKSTTHLQIEFNTLKQRTGENARTYGLRADKLTMDLYESMIEGRQHYTTENKRAILDILQQQALENYQIGLNDDTKAVVRSRGYATLQEAIAAASAEERIKGTAANRPKPKYNTLGGDNYKNKLQCRKCGKMGHHGKDCRSSRYANRFALPQPEKSRVNAVDKFCKHCKKRGHTRNECWHLNGKTINKTSKGLQGPRHNNIKDNNTRKTIESRKKKNSDSESSSEEERGSAGKQDKCARSYQVAQVTRAAQPSSGLDQITLPIQETRSGEIDMLFDSGATLSLIKVKTLKGKTKISSGKITLAGITGHKMHTIGSMQAHIKLGEQVLEHTMYVVKDDFPMEYDGILGLDFMKKHRVVCDYDKQKLKIAGVSFKLRPCGKITLQPRSETIVRAITNRNQPGVIQAKETKPGVYIGRCLVEPKNFACAISVINTTNKPVEIRTPHVTIEDHDENDYQIYAVINEAECTDKPRSERI